jgi:hypothetical protein
MKKLGCLLLSAGWLPALTGLGQSAWLPAEGKIVVTPTYVYQSFREFWIRRDQKVRLDDRVTQHSGLVNFEYGLAESFALDATVGYSRVDSKAFSGPGGGTDSSDGMADTRVGLRWRIVDEREAKCVWSPTLTVRVGGVIAGTYEVGPPFAPGDGANGGEFSLLAAKAVGDTGFGLYGEAGYRVRSNPVPHDFFGLFGVYQSIGAFTVSAAYRHVQSLNGSNIGDPGFSFPGLKEINQTAEFGLGYRDSGGRLYQIFGGLSLDGRNTGDKTILGCSASFPF